VKRLLSLTCALTVSGCTPRSDDLAVDPARECQTAAQLYASSEHGGPYMSRTLWRVHECPQEAGRIVAELLTATRLERDTAVVQRQTSLAQYVHDARVLEAALVLAVDSTATVAARLGALRALLWAKAPGHSYHALSFLLEPPKCVPPRCTSSYTGHFYGPGPVAGDTIRWPAFGLPMPAGYVGQIDRVATSIYHDSLAPDDLRDAAKHVAAFPPDAELWGR
jgi:hypothetical protein